MSVQAMGWALKQQTKALSSKDPESKDPLAKLVLICLANYADSEGRSAFPSVARLVRDTDMAERTVRGKLDDLEAMGLIRKGDQSVAAAHVKDVRRTPVCYELVIRGASDAPQESKGCTGRSSGVQPTQFRGASGAPNPSSNRQLTSVSEVLLKRERPPEGREPDYASEFRKRFGTDPV